jgi:hypothetical protein
MEGEFGTVVNWCGQPSSITIPVGVCEIGASAFACVHSVKLLILLWASSRFETAAQNDFCCWVSVTMQSQGGTLKFPVERIHLAASPMEIDPSVLSLNVWNIVAFERAAIFDQW